MGASGISRGRHLTVFLGQIPLEFKLQRSSSEKPSGMRQLNAETGNPIKLQRVDSITGAVVAQLVSGKEVSKGQFVQLSEDEMEGAFAERETDIRVVKVEDAQDIPVAAIKSHYWLTPENRAFYDMVAPRLASGVKQLRFLVVEGRQAHEAILKISPQGTPSMTVLHFNSDLKPAPEFDAKCANPDLAAKVDALLTKMTGTVIPPVENVRDEIIDSLVARKLTGEKIEFKPVTVVNSAQRTAEQLLEASL